MTTHVMIDIETLGTDPDAVILTIGGVKFDPNDESRGTWDHFYYSLDIAEQMDTRSTTDETIEWWAKTNPKMLLEELDNTDRTPVIDVLKALNRWQVATDNIWAQGILFDLGILENIYREYEHHIPWTGFWRIRDSRTLIGLMEVDPRKSMTFEAHNALEDCKVQALGVQRTLKHLGVTHL
jgi:hypothetical protein